jgi:signal transduction histidine kinase
MRLKTKLVIAITTLVFLIAGLLSLVYVSQLLHAAVQQTYDTSHMIASQVRFAVQRALERGLADQRVDPNNPAQLRALLARVVREDAGLAQALESVNRYSLTVYDVNIADSTQTVMLSTNPDFEDKPLQPRQDFKQMINANAIQLMSEVFGEPRVYDVHATLARNGEPFAIVHVGVRTTLLRASYRPWLVEALTLMGVALLAALLVAFLLSNLALRPMERISRQLDQWTLAGEAAEAKRAPKQDMAEQVQTKIEMIGQRMRNVEEVFSALKENLDQILGNLQDGIVLFTGDGRAVLVSEAARRFLQIESAAILGRQAEEIFDQKTVLGRVLGEAFAAQQPLAKVEVRTENGRRIQASLDFIHDEAGKDGASRQGLGALVTLHDLESAEAIESELELSRRMAAIGRLTSGVGHEVKNPINAIVVHLELLKNKLGETSAPAMRHLEVIDVEIHRLDRVVQTLVDFSRPVELDLRERDLRSVVGDVLTLATDELRMHNVTLESQMPETPLTANVDGDLLKQAVLNVVQNGAQAMPEGGRLTVVLEEAGKMALIRIADQGVGIPADIREKIFDLYFTTKAEGSGIGLAMTYRILQLHHGNIEVQSDRDRGTEFVLRIPLSAADWGRRHPQQADAELGKGLAG